MFNNPRSRLLSSIGRSQARMFSVRNKSPLLPHLYVSPSKKQPREFLLDQDQTLISHELEGKIYISGSRGPGLAVNSTKGFNETIKPILCNSVLYNRTREVLSLLLPQLEFYQNSLIVLEGAATKRLFIYFSNTKKMVFSICCSEKVSAVADGRSLKLRCEACGDILIRIQTRNKINRSENLTEIDKLRASNLVNSGRYCRANILEEIKESHQRHHMESSKHEMSTDPVGYQAKPRRRFRVVESANFHDETGE